MMSGVSEISLDLVVKANTAAQPLALEHEIFREARGVTLDGLIQPASRHALNRRQIAIDDDAVAAKQKDRVDRHERCLSVLRHVRRSISSGGLNICVASGFLRKCPRTIMASPRRAADGGKRG
jgi:hypothetical protein